MLLAIDIGNTDFTIGVFQGKKLCDTFRMRTKINRTSDEYGVFILNTLQYKGYDTKDVEDVIIASVVPAVMHSFNSAIIKYFGLTPIIVGPGIRTGIRIATTNPKETGRSGPHCRCSRCVYFIRRTNNCCGFWNSNNI